MADDIQALQLADFMAVFSGNIHNFGQHTYNFTTEGKEKGKNATITDKLITINEYKAHINGTMGLGIIPIDMEGNARFGVIDVDVYDDDLTLYINTLERLNFPLVPFKSKSGGLHIYMFLKQAVNAKFVIDALVLMASTLGLDLYVKRKLNRIIEIFPKQAKTNGGIGNWINLPYYNTKQTIQYAIRNGKKLDLDNALTYIKEKTRTLDEVNAFINELPYKDYPPCLQTISLLNVMGPNTGRNTFLFSFGVCLKKSNPEFWEQQLFEINAEMSTPLPMGELENIVNSLRKKDYAYKCKEAPCSDYCRKAICKTREFGVGKESGYFSELEFGRLIQVKAYEPYYEWEVRIIGADEFKMLRFKNEQDIIGQEKFLCLCFRELYLLPAKMKQQEWCSLINQALRDVEVLVVDKEDDTSSIGMFKTLFLEFLIDRAMAQTKEQILHKRVYYDSKVAAYYFRSQDLSDFIFGVKGFKFIQPCELHGLLRDFGAKPGRIKTESGKQLRVYSMLKDDTANIGLIATELFEAKFDTQETDF